MKLNDDYLDPDKYGLFVDEYDNTEVKEAFLDYESLYDLYRSVYKYTPCGPTVGALIGYFEQPDSLDDYEREAYTWFYGDDLRQLGTFKDMDEQGLLICQLSVSSIVEGVEETTQTHIIECNPDYDGAAISKNFWKAVKLVDYEANMIWHDTHGCETCRKHWIELGNNPDDFDPIPTWSECPDCDGDGIVI